MRLLGALLAGGQSRRFGSDKAEALYQGRPLIEHGIAWLRRHSQHVVVCGRTWQSLPTVADYPRPGLGPLGGIAGALRYGAANGFDAVLTAPCDAVDLPEDLLAAMPVAPWYLADLPVVGMWPCVLAGALAQHLAESNDRSMRGWGRRTGARAASLAQPFANINTPEDLALLSREGSVRQA